MKVKMDRSQLSNLVEYILITLLFIALMIVTYNITQRHNKQQKQIQFITEFISRSNSGLIISDMDGKIISWSSGAESLLLFKSDEVIGKNVDILIPERYRERHGKSMLAAVKSSKTDFTHIISCEILRKDGVKLPVVVIVRLGFDAQNKATFMASIVQPADTFKFTNLTRNENVLHSDFR